MLVGGELKDLPAPRRIHRALLCIPVTNSNPNATTQVAVVLLNKPFRKMQPYDFKDFGQVIGTVLVPKQPQAGPAKYYRIDLTRALKRIAASDAKFHGLAIRTVPNRSIDDGWTVRIDITKNQPTYIDLEAYAEGKGVGSLF